MITSFVPVALSADSWKFQWAGVSADRGLYPARCWAPSTPSDFSWTLGLLEDKSLNNLGPMSQSNPRTVKGWLRMSRALGRAELRSEVDSVVQELCERLHFGSFVRSTQFHQVLWKLQQGLLL